MIAMTSRTRVLAGVGILVLALILSGIAVVGHVNDRKSAESSSSASSQSPIPDSEAQKSSRYGHFGEGTQNGTEGDTPQQWTPDRKQAAETLAKDTVNAWIGDHHDPDSWRKRLHEHGNDAFRTTVSGMDPAYITEGKVTDLGTTDYTTPEAKITVKTSAGDYDVGVIPGDKEPEVSYVAAKWRSK